MFTRAEHVELHALVRGAPHRDNPVVDPGDCREETRPPPGPRDAIGGDA